MEEKWLQGASVSLEFVWGCETEGTTISVWESWLEMVSDRSGDYIGGVGTGPGWAADVEVA